MIIVSTKTNTNKMVISSLVWLVIHIHMWYIRSCTLRVCISGFPTMSCFRRVFVRLDINHLGRFLDMFGDDGWMKIGLCAKLIILCPKAICVCVSVWSSVNFREAQATLSFVKVVFSTWSFPRIVFSFPRWEISSSIYTYVLNNISLWATLGN